MNNAPIATLPASILVVDDNRENLRLLAGVLTQQGYTVRAAPDGHLALASVQAELPDLILLDVMMPGIGGYEVCTQLKADEHTRDIPVIFISVATDVFDKTKAFSVGGVDYITKPFQMEEVLARVETHLALRAMQKQLEERNTQLEQEIAERIRAEKALRQQTAQLEALRELGLEITAQLDLDALLHSIVSRAVELLGGTAGGFGIHRPDQNVLDYVAYTGLDSVPGETTFRRGEGLCGTIWETGEPLIVDNYKRWEGRLAAWEDHLLHVADVGVPVCWGDEFLGVLDVIADLPRTFSPTDVELLSLFATQAAIAIHNARLYEAVQQELAERKQAEEVLRRRNQELALLNQVGQELSATLDLQQVTRQLLQAVTETVGARGASVWLWDEGQEGWLVCRAASHHDLSHSPLNLRLCPGQGIAGWVAQTGESVVVANAPDDPRFFPGIDEQTGLRTTSLLAVPLRARGEVIGVLEVINKLSGDFDGDDLALVETMAASAAIAADNARLVEALHHRTAELEARNEELDAFAHTVAHDLKSPLAWVIGYADVLQGDHATLSDEEVHDWLGTIAKDGRKMSAIIDELLLLSTVRKVEEIETHPLDMASIVAEAQDRLAPMIEEYQAEIIRPETWPTALGYGPWIEEIWANYLSNALKYGGRPPRVELGATEQTDGTVCYWIRDNGPGISPEDQARLFTLFTRLDQVRAKGHGLGLSIVRRIMEKLGGQVGVESEMGQGSVFWFTLPK